MAFHKMSKSDKKAFQEMGIIKGGKKAVSYSLVYSNKGDTETIMDQKAYALCKHKKNTIRHWMQYRDGNLNIIPNY